MPRHRLVVLGLLAVVVAGCVHPKDPSLRVNALQADIVFGLKPTTTTAPPPAAPALPTQQPGPVSSNGTPLDFNVPELPVDLPIFLGPAAPPCPSAALDAFPDQSASVTVSTLPKIGTYKWELGGAKSAGINIQPVSGEEKRLLRRATKIPQISSDNADSVDFTYEVLEPYDNKGSVLQLSYQVRSDNQGQRYESAPAGNAQVYAASPDAGLSLVSEDVIDRNGNLLPLFHPSQPLLLLPLPIQEGGKFNSVAADPSDGEVTVIQATVLRRARVDACGSIIEGWEVNGSEQTQSTNGTSSANQTQFAQIDNIYATQLGTMPIAEHTLESSPTGSSSVDDAIGQEKPGPLPAGTA